MNLAVKFYQDCHYCPAGMPKHWPAEVIELGEGTELPEGPWLLMTKEQYEEYRATHLKDYEAYENSIMPVGGLKRALALGTEHSKHWQRIRQWLGLA